MEDDADWDVSLKQQLREFARGLRTLSPTTTATKQAPYGTDWDLLWVGDAQPLPEPMRPSSTPSPTILQSQA